MRCSRSLLDRSVEDGVGRLEAAADDETVGSPLVGVAAPPQLPLAGVPLRMCFAADATSVNSATGPIWEVLSTAARDFSAGVGLPKAAAFVTCADGWPSRFCNLGVSLGEFVASGALNARSEPARSRAAAMLRLFFSVTSSSDARSPSSSAKSPATRPTGSLCSSPLNLAGALGSLSNACTTHFVGGGSASEVAVRNASRVSVPSSTSLLGQRALGGRATEWTETINCTGSLRCPSGTSMPTCLAAWATLQVAMVSWNSRDSVGSKTSSGSGCSKARTLRFPSVQAPDALVRGASATDAPATSGQ